MQGQIEPQRDMAAMPIGAFCDMRTEVVNLRCWLFEAALPLWWLVGADHSLGGYYERIDFEGKAVALPRRARVAARQAFCFCEAGRLGWTGPWREAATHALDFFCARFLTRDGTVVAVVGQDGAVIDATFDLYNQAFALLAFALAYRSLGHDSIWRDHACTLRESLRRNFAHPLGGFFEDRGARQMLRSNPHMHLLEAALAWTSIDDDPAWRACADEIVALALDRFVDPATDALREFFTSDWSPAPGRDGRVVEPGHHYEWAFLLDRWAQLTGSQRPSIVARLIAFADAYGVDRARVVAVNAIEIDGKIRDPVARLWPQTERIRAYTIDRHINDIRLREAITSLWRYLNTPLRGLWFERLSGDGRFVNEAAPATSLYHIVGAIAELLDAFG